MKAKKPKTIVANQLTIVDDEGNPKIGLHAFGKSGYAGISFYKGKGKKRYQALHIYISDHQHGVVEFWSGPSQTALTLGVGPLGSGMSLYDEKGRHVKAIGVLYDEIDAGRIKDRKKKKSVSNTKRK